TTFRRVVAIDWCSGAREVLNAFPRPQVFQQEGAALESLLSFCHAAGQDSADLTSFDRQPVSQQSPLLSAVQHVLAPRKEQTTAVPAAEKRAALPKQGVEGGNAVRTQTVRLRTDVLPGRRTWPSCSGASSYSKRSCSISRGIHRPWFFECLDCLQPKRR